MNFWPVSKPGRQGAGVQTQFLALATRGRGLLAHGTGRLTIYAIGQRLGVDDDTDATTALRQRFER